MTHILRTFPQYTPSYIPWHQTIQSPPKSWRAPTTPRLLKQKRLEDHDENADFTHRAEMLLQVLLRRCQQNMKIDIYSHGEPQEFSGGMDPDGEHV